MVLGTTRATLHHLKMVARRVAVSFTLITQLVYVGYLVYALCVGRGTVWINATLCALSGAYLCFFIAMELRLNGMSDKERRAEKKRTKGIGKAYRWTKLVAKGVNLGILLYGIWSGAESSTPFSTILTTLMVMIWVLEVLFSVGAMVVDYIVTVLLEALEEDKRAVTEAVSSPVKKVVNGVKRLFGKEVKEEERKPRPKKFDVWEEELKEYINNK